MLIYLDSTIESDIDSGDITDSDICAIDYILEAAYHGYHLVTGERSIFSKLVSLNKLSPLRGTPTAKKLFHESTQNHSLVNQLPRFVKAVSSKQSSEIIDNGGTKIYKIPLSKFDSPATTLKTVILSEDHDDCRLYQIIGNSFVYNNSAFRNLKIQCELLGGGGTSIVDHYDVLRANRERFCLCICDSDKLYDGASLGDNAKKLLKSEQSDNIKTEVFVLPVRDIDNLIPLNLLDNLCVCYVDYCRPRKFIEAVDKLSISVARSYFDMKNGLSLNNLLSRPNADQLRMLWCGVISCLNGHYDEVKPCFLTCECDGGCKPSDCTITGFGDRLLQLTVQEYDRLSPRERAHSICNATKQYWHDIGLFVLSWCCAKSPLRS